MVQVRDHHPIKTNGSIDINAWLEDLTVELEIADVSRIRQACEMSEQALENASDNDDEWDDAAVDCFRTGLEMAVILASLKVNEETLVAAILYRSVRENKLPLETVGKTFGPTVKQLINGVLQMAAISSLQSPTRDNVLGQTDGQLTNVRKMLVSLVDDVRVALIKLAERTCAIRAVKNGDRKKRYLVSREVFDVYAPLAHRLGIGTIKWELEDLSFRYLQPNAYKQIASLLDERRLDRQNYIDSVLATLRQNLGAAGIKADIMGRAKHIYSIWRKMQRKNIEFSQVYDVRAVRILVPQLSDCYTSLGIVHGLWRNIPQEFDDYIATPKENGYRSLHTAVIGPDGKVVEIQIRTFAMHDEAELGVCAHWLYKGTDTKSNNNSYEDKLVWLRQVLEWHDEVGDSSALVDQVRADVEQDRIYVFTPDGHVVDLPNGATPLDFAYRVHTEVGNTCRGAKVHGRIVPLTFRLQTGDQISILTAKGGTPSRDWMNSNLGYVNSSRTRAKIAHFFKQQDKEKNAAAGRQLVERELRRMALHGVDEHKLAANLNFKLAEDMYAALGAGDLRLAQVINASQQQLEPQLKRRQQMGLALETRRTQPVQGGSGDICIAGVGNLLTSLAGCCQPVPGDDIAGFITLNR
ncbi:MAG: bifunctional (p)ppGpp synthetase/guanosine-3',5'-bis(diphosphate) 3'-pyrophosphohydrolase, partial [Gammaproteobacteria bacterium]|nr:bifunctional (p)ppGpp synthetase/guanosine-3',5'-bis(diphosphate) 3'-pyrophosphohydrolase [Gammaproteobacteria bacterium]